MNKAEVFMDYKALGFFSVFYDDDCFMNSFSTAYYCLQLIFSPCVKLFEAILNCYSLKKGIPSSSDIIVVF